MYELTVDTSTDRHYQATTGTGDEALAILRRHLARHLLTGPVSWTITSPWGAEHLGRINLNGNTTELDAYLDQTLYGEYSTRESLAREVDQQHRVPEPSNSISSGV